MGRIIIASFAGEILVRLTTAFVTSVLLAGSASVCAGGKTVDAPGDPNAAVAPMIEAAPYGFDLLDIGRALAHRRRFSSQRHLGLHPCLRLGLRHGRAPIFSRLVSHSRSVSPAT